jgi:23S rRNA pseudouridine1911/1915/1917 synthase
MTGRTDTFTVEHSRPGARLDKFLCDRYPQVSRGAIQRLIESGDIRVNDRPAKPTHHPRAGETVTVHFPEPKPAEAKAEDIPLEILFEDEHLLVVNKHAGLVTHPAAGNEEHTLVNALLHHCRGQLSGIGGVARPGIVHRLDKDTSGCLVVAKHDEAHVALAHQFAMRKVEKLYLALLCGELPRDTGDIRAAIARHPSHRKRMAVSDERGREAWTSYQVRERLEGATLVVATLHTGRTHQIRVHFQHLGFPLVGDETYGNRHSARRAGVSGCTAPRQMLHAWKLAFIHPHTAKRVAVEAPPPEDFEAALSALRSSVRRAK